MSARTRSLTTEEMLDAQVGFWDTAILLPALIDIRTKLRRKYRLPTRYHALNRISSEDVEKARRELGLPEGLSSSLRLALEAPGRNRGDSRIPDGAGTEVIIEDVPEPLRISVSVSLPRGKTKAIVEASKQAKIRAKQEWDRRHLESVPRRAESVETEGRWLARYFVGRDGYPQIAADESFSESRVKQGVHNAAKALKVDLRCRPRGAPIISRRDL